MDKSGNVYNHLTITKALVPSQQDHSLQRKIENINKLSLRDATLQEEIYHLLKSTNQEQNEGRKTLRGLAQFPLRFTPNLRSKSKWQVRWHAKAAPLVKYAYQIFHGSINPNNPRSTQNYAKSSGYRDDA